MAKRTDKPEPTKDQPEASAEDLQLAERAVMDIMGFGHPAARARVKAMATSMVVRIAELERADKRVEIVTLLYT